MADRAVRRANLPVIVLGLVLAALGFLGAYLLSGAHPAPSGSGAMVVVTTRDVAARVPLVGADLTLQDYAGGAPPGALTAISAAAGRVPLVDLKSGQPVLSNLIAGSAPAVTSPAAFLPIPAGEIAYSLPSGEQQGVSGYIQAGDFVDVIAVVVPQSGGQANVETIYKDLPVVRVGPASGTSVASQGPAAGVTSSLVVAVTPCQAEFLTWFITNAQVRYALPSHLDYPSSAPAANACSASASGQLVTVAAVRTQWPGLF